MADLDGDDRLDLVSYRADTLEVRMAAADGGFGPLEKYLGGAFLAVADFSGDGRPDVALRQDDGTIVVRVNLGDGRLQEPQTYGAIRPGEVQGFAAADLDRDGYADLVAARNTGSWSPGDEPRDSLVVLWNLGSRRFAPEQSHPLQMDVVDYIVLSVVADFNDDGRADVATISSPHAGAGHAFSLSLQQPDRSFVSTTQPSPGKDPSQVVAADLDRDGFVDLATAGYDTDHAGHIQLLRGKGDGSFDVLPRFWAGLYPAGIAATDFNGDGRTDLATVGESCGEVLVFPNASQPPPPTPALVSLVAREASPARVRIRWYSAGSAGASGRVERAIPGKWWEPFTIVRADGDGFVDFEDIAVVPGARYGYRLVLGIEGGQLVSDDVWLDIPLMQLALLGPISNPASDGRCVVRFSLPGPGAATLDLIDIAGRKIVSREVGSLGAGTHAVDLATGKALAAGVYSLRLRQGGTALTRQAIILQ